MKRIVAILILLITVYNGLAQGKYAGAKKNLVGKIYTDSKKIPGLSGWQFREGSVITRYDDPEVITIDVFQKETTGVVILSVMEDTASGVYAIKDVLEVKNILKGWQIRTAFCRNNKVDNIEILALVKSTTAQYVKTVKKAWRANKDKRRFEVLGIKGIDCESEGGD